MGGRWMLWSGHAKVACLRGCGSNSIQCERWRSNPCVPTMLVDAGKCHPHILSYEWGGPLP